MSDKKNIADVAQEAEDLMKAADAGGKAIADAAWTDEHYEVYIDAAEKLVKTLISVEAENTRFLIAILRAVADELENY